MSQVFGTPIIIGVYRISNVSQAHAVLLNGWPTKHTAHWAHAVHACSAAQRGAIPLNKARKAFERAAKEAGYK